MSSCRTQPAAGYITPSADEIRQTAEKIGLKQWSVSLAQDLANLASGGQVLPPSQYRNKIESGISKKLQPDSGGDYPTHGFSQYSYTKDRDEGLKYAVRYQMRYHQNVSDFLQTLNIEQAIGSTPLEKAITTLKLLSQQSGGSGGGSGENAMLPIFMESDSQPEKAAESIDEQIESLEKFTDAEKQMLDPEGNNFKFEEQGQFTNELAKLKVAEDLKKGSQKQVMLEISRVLDQFTRLSVSKQIRLFEDPEGEETRMRPMRSLSELQMLGGSDWAMYRANKTLFMYQAATGVTPVREKVTREERKQAIFILVDGSGSMKGTRHHKATGVVMNRLKAALTGDAVVYISVFDTKMSTPDSAETPEEAKQLIKKFADGNYRGGGTDIAAAVKTAHEYMQLQMQEGKMLYKPEIVVLTDEDDSAKNITASQVKGTRVHGFAMESSNPALKFFVESTGGLYFHNF